MMRTLVAKRLKCFRGIFLKHSHGNQDIIDNLIKSHEFSDEKTMDIHVPLMAFLQ